MPLLALGVALQGLDAPLSALMMAVQGLLAGEEPPEPPFVFGGNTYGARPVRRGQRKPRVVWQRPAPPVIDTEEEDLRLLGVL